MEEVATLFDSDEAKYEYMKEREEKEKQIEELREFIRCMDGSTYLGGPIRVVNYNALAIALYNAGYRKQSEVAEEIFEEIESLLNRYYNDAWYTIPDMDYDIAELKKKYTGATDTNVGHRTEEEDNHG